MIKELKILFLFFIFSFLPKIELNSQFSRYSLKKLNLRRDHRSSWSLGDSVKEVKMIKAVMAINTQGKPRLTKFYDFLVITCFLLNNFFSESLPFIFNFFPFLNSLFCLLHRLLRSNRSLYAAFLEVFNL